MENEQLLSVQQVAEYLQVNRSTVYDWAQKGKLPAIKLGQMWRFRRSELDTWLESHKVESQRESSDLKEAEEGVSASA